MAQARWLKTQGLSPAEIRVISLLQSAYAEYGPHSESYTVVEGSLSPVVKRPQREERMRGAVLLLPPYASRSGA